MAEIWELDAVGQLDLLRRREIAPMDAHAAAIARIDWLNPALNAVVIDLRERARPGTVPMLLKDAGQEVAGTPHWVATAALRDAEHRSSRTTPLVGRLEAIGLSVIGKTNLPELSTDITTESALLGPARNPWDLTRSAGGSSGGSAAAVAARLVPIAHGGDATGSLRWPAACCGVFTLVPTRGRVPSLPAAGMTDPLRIWREFVLTRSVRDLRWCLEKLGSPSPHPPPDRALRIGVLQNDPFFGRPVAAPQTAGVERSAAVLAAAGHDVCLAAPALDTFVPRCSTALVNIAARGRSSQFRWLEARLGRPLAPEDVSERLFVEAAYGRAIADDRFADDLRVIRRWADDTLAWWDRFDVLLTPMLLDGPWPLGSNRGVQDPGFFPFPFSFTGQPAAVAPVLLDPSGLPVAVQLVGRHGADETLLAVSTLLEQACPIGALPMTE